MKMKVLLSTFPFGKYDKSPIKLLEETGWEIIYNPFKRRLKPSDMPELTSGVDGIIAGTEPYTRELFERNKGSLKVISRVGIGLDSIDFGAAHDNDVKITYTPDAPSQAVAELTVAQIINLNRYIMSSDRSIRSHAWNRMIGWLICERKIGLLGLGRIAKKVAQLLKPFGCQILVSDPNPDLAFIQEYGLTLVDSDELFRTSDVLSVHIPLNSANHKFICRDRIAMMKTGAFFINTSRGPVVDEAAITDALLQGHIGAAALDVFEKEPYEGVLSKLDNVILTGHIGASAKQTRLDMEYRATEDCIRVLKGLPPLRPAPTPT
jgi:D-3-phosphoglycerate dehydrogenase / 2-oxoglutarate reductase